MSTTIKCPKCGHGFAIDDAIAGPLVAEARAAAIADADARVAAARKQIETDAKQRADAAAIDEVSRANAAMKAAQEREISMSAKLATAQTAQAEAVRKSREADDRMREANLLIETKVSEGLLAARQQAEADAEQRIGSKLAERDLQIESLKKASEELQRKLAQGSMQIQGEAQELALEAALAARFPTDNIEPVGKGVTGGDCVLRVTGAGSILFESKQTKAWAQGWLAKLRDDGRAAKVDLLVIVTTALPKGVEAFDQVEGVWVCLPRHAVSLAVALRQALQEVAAAKAANEGAETKALQVYSYMTGPRFKSRVSAIVEAFTTMKDDLEAEKRAIQKQWSKRDGQIERVLQGTVGMYGDLQAIAGRALAEVEGLSLEGPK